MVEMINLRAHERPFPVRQSGFEALGRFSITNLTDHPFGFDVEKAVCL